MSKKPKAKRAAPLRPYRVVIEFNPAKNTATVRLRGTKTVLSHPTIEWEQGPIDRHQMFDVPTFIGWRKFSVSGAPVWPRRRSKP